MQLLHKGAAGGRGCGLFSISFGQATHFERQGSTQTAKHGKLISYANLAQNRTDGEGGRRSRSNRVRLAGPGDHPKILLKFRNLQSQKSQELTEFYGKIIIGTRAAYWLALARWKMPSIPSTL